MSKQIPFTKMHGCGNDFIVIDNRNQILQEQEIVHFVQMISKRKFHIGANGARCFAKFVYHLDIADDSMTIETLDGLYEARVLNNEEVQVRLRSILRDDIYLHQQLVNEHGTETYHYIWAGVPHVVIFVENNTELDDAAFVEWAIGVKEHEHFREHGTNVNLVEVSPDATRLNIRTYERGVEEETLACGSGAIACAIIASLVKTTSAPIQVKTRGGILTVDFILQRTSVQQITLTGNAVTVFTGVI